MNLDQVKTLFAEGGISRSVEKVRFKFKSQDYLNKEISGNGGTKDIAHVTYCIARNAGDTVLSQCVRKVFNSHIKNSGWNIIPVTEAVNQGTVETINRCQKLVIGGGGLFLPDTNENTISGWQWAIPGNMLCDIRVPICVYSVGYNYFRGQKANEMFVDSLRKLVDKSSFFGLRNNGSVTAIKQMLPKELSDKVVFQPCTTTLIRKIYQGIEDKTENGTVAVNLAFDRENLRFGNKKEIILNQIADAISQIYKKGYKIFYVCHCWDDDKFTPYLKKKNIRYTLVDLSHRYPESIIDFYNKMDVVIGMRGHAQMIPFGVNCEIISLGSHDKMKWFLEDIDALDWYIDLSEDIQDIGDRIVDVFIKRHELERDITQKRLIECQNKLWNQTEENMRRINEL